MCPDSSTAPTKICPKCSRELPATREFFYANKVRGKDGLRSECIGCNLAYAIAHREEKRVYARAYHASHLEEARAHRRVKRLAREPILRAWAPGGCLVCGFVDLRAIAAHHRDPKEKERSVSLTLELGDLKAELAKTIPLCHNHHAILHAMWRNGGAGMSTEDAIELMKGEL